VKLLDQVINLWARKWGTTEITGQIVARASRPMHDLLLRVAADPNDRTKLSPQMVGEWLSDNKNKPSQGWKFVLRIKWKQAMWRLTEALL
jgi:hypothetical protein